MIAPYLTQEELERQPGYDEYIQSLADYGPYEA
jgi:hypothetical protein